MSIRDWFIEPRVAPAPEPDGDIAATLPQPARAPADDVATTPARPVRDPGGDVATGLAPPAGEPPAWASPAPERLHNAARSAPRSSHSRSAAFSPPASESRDAAGRLPRSAAVIGRPGDTEPVAAALALALRGAARAPAVAVVVVSEEPACPPAAGVATRGARRLAARLVAHGFEASARGRLAWVSVPESSARRAAGIGAPAVVVVTAPLSSSLEAVVSDQELAIVVAPGGDGPLARVAVASLARPGLEVRCIPPLQRGISRALARAGLRAPPALRRVA